MVQMAAVGNSEGLSSSRPPKESEEKVDQRHAQDDHRDDERSKEKVCLTSELIGGTPTDQDRCRRQQETQKHRSSVTHKDGRWRPIVWQESHTDPDRDGEHEGPDVALEEDADLWL